MRKIYDETVSGDGTLDPALWESELKKIFTEFEKGFGKKLSSAAWGTPDWEYLQNLKHNTAVFSAFKQNTEIREAYQYLFDAQGNRRTWKEFRDTAMSTVEKYNVRWLKTEYNQAHQTARMAAKWKRFEEGKDLYPNLMYVAVMDERTRESHAKLNGTVRPIDDPFWATYYPPNGWGCRCTVRASDKDVTDLPGDIVDMPSMFDNNTGKTAEIFAANNPYTAASADAAARINSFAGERVKTAQRLLEDRAEFDAWEANSDYTRDYFSRSSGGYYVSHKGHNWDKNTGNYEKNALKELADNGRKVMANAEYNVPVPDCTDLLTGENYEIKTVLSYTANGITKELQKGLKKAANVVLYFPDGVDYGILRAGYSKLLNNIKTYNFTRTGKIYYLKDGKLTWFADI